MADEMVAWLRGVLDETARVARAAVAAGWYDFDVLVRDEPMGSPVVRHSWPQEYHHVDRHNPRSVLARVEAERSVIVEHRPDDYYGELCRIRCGEWPCVTLRLLAYGHRFDAQGYREEWKPNT